MYLMMQLLIKFSFKTLSLIVTELFIRWRKPDISIAFIAKPYFQVPRDVRLNCTHFSIIKIVKHMNQKIKTEDIDRSHRLEN